MNIKANKWLLIATGAFLSIEALLGFLLQTAHGRAVAIYSYASILLACTFCAVLALKSRAYLFTQLGLLFTAGADFFLVYLPVARQLPAMILFSFTQLCYFARLLADDSCKKRRYVHVYCRVGACALALLLTALVLGGTADALAMVSMFYYANLVLNIVFAFLLAERPPLFAIALMLFLCCDTLIGLSFLNAYFSIPEGSFIYRIIHPGFNLAWAFYLPSQALIAISLLPKRLQGARNEDHLSS